MKYFVLSFLFAFLMACSHERNNSNDMSFGLQLFEGGFLDFADTLKLDSLKSGLVNSFDIYNEDNNKIAHIDAEELAEFSFDFFLPRLNNMLGRREFKLVVQTAHDYDSNKEVFINGKR